MLNEVPAPQAVVSFNTHHYNSMAAPTQGTIYPFQPPGMPSAYSQLGAPLPSASYYGAQWGGQPPGMPSAYPQWGNPPPAASYYGAQWGGQPPGMPSAYPQWGAPPPSASYYGAQWGDQSSIVPHNQICPRNQVLSIKLSIRLTLRGIMKWLELGEFSNLCLLYFKFNLCFSRSICLLVVYLCSLLSCY